MIRQKDKNLTFKLAKLSQLKMFNCNITFFLLTTFGPGVFIKYPGLVKNGGLGFLTEFSKLLTRWEGHAGI